MSVGINPGGYNPAFAAGEAAPQNVPQQTEMPPSDKKYKKNGKKVRANVGPLGGTVICLMGASAGTGYIKDYFEEKASIDRFTQHVAENKENLQLATTDIERKSFQSVINSNEDAIKFSKKALKSDIKGGIIGGLIGIGASLGAVLLTNHLRNNKRAALAAEPENPALDKQA